MRGSGCINCPVKHCTTMQYRGSTCAAQRALYGLGDPSTAGDKIRAMFATDEGIADILLGLDISFEDTGREFSLLYCDGKNNCIDEDGNITCTDEMRKACILRWLRQPAEGTHHTISNYEDKQESGLLEEYCP